ncbi:hypothetical protein HPB49_009966 [Dermacentor silvarum]|uniref:Uncharacterized protein n=1 Tax=Dermacentor silvarum TaxID=543639 RepID=A0ACB8CWM4_DERSI|nr:hypothetical protein HPB49_009966 [Dermacentor silvarum]
MAKPIGQDRRSSLKNREIYPVQQRQPLPDCSPALNTVDKATNTTPDETAPKISERNTVPWSKRRLASRQKRLCIIDQANSELDNSAESRHEERLLYRDDISGAGEIADELRLAESALFKARKKGRRPSKTVTKDLVFSISSRMASGGGLKAPPVGVPACIGMVADAMTYSASHIADDCERVSQQLTTVEPSLVTPLYPELNTDPWSASIPCSTENVVCLPPWTGPFTRRSSADGSNPMVNTKFAIRASAEQSHLLRRESAGTGYKDDGAAFSCQCREPVNTISEAPVSASKRYTNSEATHPNRNASDAANAAQANSHQIHDTVMSTRALNFGVRSSSHLKGEPSDNLLTLITRENACLRRTSLRAKSHTVVYQPSHSKQPPQIQNETNHFPLVTADLDPSTVLCEVPKKKLESSQGGSDQSAVYERERQAQQSPSQAAQGVEFTTLCQPSHSGTPSHAPYNLARIRTPTLPSGSTTVLHGIAYKRDHASYGFQSFDNGLKPDDPVYMRVSASQDLGVLRENLCEQPTRDVTRRPVPRPRTINLSKKERKATKERPSRDAVSCPRKPSAEEGESVNRRNDQLKTESAIASEDHVKQKTVPNKTPAGTDERKGVEDIAEQHRSLALQAVRARETTMQKTPIVRDSADSMEANKIDIYSMVLQVNCDNSATFDVPTSLSASSRKEAEKKYTFDNGGQCDASAVINARKNELVLRETALPHYLAVHENEHAGSEADKQVYDCELLGSKAVELNGVCVPGIVVSPLPHATSRITVKTWPFNGTTNPVEVWRTAGIIARKYGVPALLDVVVGVQRTTNDSIVELRLPRSLFFSGDESRPNVKHMFRDAIREAATEFNQKPMAANLTAQIMAVFKGLAAVSDKPAAARSCRVRKLKHIDNSVRTFVAAVFNGDINPSTTVVVRNSDVVLGGLVRLTHNLSVQHFLNYLGFRLLVRLAVLLPEHLVNLRRLFSVEFTGRVVQDDLKWLLCMRLAEAVAPTCLENLQAKMFAQKRAPTLARRFWLLQMEDFFSRNLRLYAWISEKTLSLMEKKMERYKFVHVLFDKASKNGTGCEGVRKLLASRRRLKKSQLVPAILATWETFQGRYLTQTTQRLLPRDPGFLFEAHPRLAKSLQTVYVPPGLVNASVPENSTMLAFHLSRVATRLFRTLVPLASAEGGDQCSGPSALTQQSQRSLARLRKCLTKDAQSLPSQLQPRASDVLWDGEGREGEEAGFAILAQTAALGLAFAAFKEMLRVDRIWRLDFRFASLANVSAEQLFFLYYALDNCERSDRTHRAHAYGAWRRLPAEQRVNLPLRQMAHFAEAFGCESGRSAMAPMKRCGVLRWPAPRPGLRDDGQ